MNQMTAKASRIRRTLMKVFLLIQTLYLIYGFIALTILSGTVEINIRAGSSSTELFYSSTCLDVEYFKLLALVLLKKQG
jgi:hypothetical protein